MLSMLFGPKGKTLRSAGIGSSHEVAIQATHYPRPAAKHWFEPSLLYHDNLDKVLRKTTLEAQP